jgi:hypothetical protein
MKLIINSLPDNWKLLAETAERLKINVTADYCRKMMSETAK